MRIERPLPLDLQAIANGVIQNNMGLGGLEVRVRGTLADGKAVLLDTGQVVPVMGGPARSTAAWLWFDAKEYGLGMAAAVTWRRESTVPAPAEPGTGSPAPR